MNVVFYFCAVIMTWEEILNESKGFILSGYVLILSGYLLMVSFYFLYIESPAPGI